jgi:hypothetical protein
MYSVHVQKVQRRRRPGTTWRNDRSGLSDANPFTPNERAALDFLRAFPQENQGRLPSTREISRVVFDSESPNAARQVLLSLARKGAIAQDRISRRFYVPMQVSALHRRAMTAAPREEPSFRERYRVDAEATRFLLNRIPYEGRGRVPVEHARVDDLGYTVIEWRLPVGESGRISPDQKLIVVNKSDSLARRSFTLAHEFGHLILHVLPGTASACIDLSTLPREDEGRLEQEADMFAALLVLPHSAVQIFVDRRNGRDALGDPTAEVALVQAVGEEFLVAPVTAALRLKGLGYISALPGQP